MSYVHSLTRNLKFFGTLALLTSTFATLHPTFRTNLLNSPTRRLMAARLAAQSPDINILRGTVHPQRTPSAQPAFPSLEAPLLPNTLPHAAATARFLADVTRAQGVLAPYTATLPGTMGCPALVACNRQYLQRVFISACKRRDEPTVRTFLEDPSLSEVIDTAEDLKGNNALHVACANGDLPLVRALLGRRTFAAKAMNALNARGENPFYRACARERNNVVELLLEDPAVTEATLTARPQDLPTALRLVVEMRERPLMERFIRRITSADYFAHGRPMPDITEQQRILRTVMTYEGFGGRSSDILRLLLDHPSICQAAVNAEGDASVLRYACIAVMSEDLPLVLDHPKLEQETINRSLKEPETNPFLRAARNNRHTTNLSVLLNHPRCTSRQAVNARDKRGWTALHHACRHGYGADAAEALLDHDDFSDASVLATSSQGKTALHVACERFAPNPDLAEAFLARPKRCASLLTLRDSNGYSPVHSLVLSTCPYNGNDFAERHHRDQLSMLRLLLGLESAEREDSTQGERRRRSRGTAPREEEEAINEEEDGSHHGTLRRYRGNSTEEDGEEGESAAAEDSRSVDSRSEEDATNGTANPTEGDVFKEGDSFFINPNIRVRRGDARPEGNTHASTDAGDDAEDVRAPYDPAAGARGQ